MSEATKTPIDLEALDKKLDQLIKIELYNNKLLLGRYRNGEEAHEEFKKSIMI